MTPAPPAAIAPIFKIRVRSLTAWGSM